MTRGLALAVSWTFLLAVACTCETAPAAATANRADPPPPGAVDPVDGAPGPGDTAGADARAEPPLTDDELRLIAADPKTLSREDVRKRAFALRRKILQNPDSPAARTLEDLRRAMDAGEIQPPGGLHFEARNSGDTRPPAPPAGTRPGDAKPSGDP